MKKIILLMMFFGMVAVWHTDNGMMAAPADKQAKAAAVDTTAVADTSAVEALDADSAMAAADSYMDNSDESMTAEEDGGMQHALKRKFIEGNAGFMSLVALALVLGLAFCIERIIYLSLSEINAKKFMADVDSKIQVKDIEGAKELCRDTRGPVASICYQGLVRINESLDNIERSISSYGSVPARG